MKYLLLALLPLQAFAGIGAYSDISVSQQGVGFRASISVAKFCITPTDPRPSCVTGAKATLYRDQFGSQNLANPFQSMDNGRFTFFVTSGWYDILVSGLGITTYSYRVYVTDGQVTTGGNAGGDLCGQYPNPVVCGLVGHPLPAANLLAENSVPAYSLNLGLWVWRVPLFEIPVLVGDTTGPVGNTTTKGIWHRPIQDSTPQNNWTILYDLPNSRWKYGAVPSASATLPMTFNLCSGVECQVAANATNPYIVSNVTVSIDACYIAARIPPTGQNLIVDIKKNGVSILASGNSNKLNLTPSGGVEAKGSLTVTGANLDVFTADIIQVGTGFHGQDVTATCRMSAQ